MKGYKGFSKGMVCRGKQYAENAVFEEENAEVCKSGMHFCKNPLDVLDYYPLVDENGNMNEFAEVEALDEAKTDDDIKYCTTKLKVGAKISFAELVQASMNFDFEKNSETKENTTNETNAQIGSSGNGAQIGSSGKNAVIMCAGNGSVAKAKKGSWITLAEWKFLNGEHTPVCVKTERVDGERIKEDTWYGLKNGEFVEVEG